MTRGRKAATLPDLDDDADFTAKLRPLQSVLPKPGRTNSQITGYADNRLDGNQDMRKTRLSVAERIEAIEAVRGPKRRFEYLISVRVGDALAADAAGKGVSAATRLLEVLRDAGYPVKPEDFVDLRKERGR